MKWRKRVNVDTTVQEKAIAFPTDAKLCHTMRLNLVRAALDRGIKLRQSYQRLSKKALVMQHRYRHANQHKRAAKMVKKIKTYLGCVVRDIRRKAAELDDELADLLSKADRLHVISCGLHVISCGLHYFLRVALLSNATRGTNFTASMRRSVKPASD